MGTFAGGVAFAPQLLAGCGGSSGSEAAVPLTVDPSVPWWLQNNFGPVSGEVEAFDLHVEGRLPPELNGLYARNGSNPQSGASQHWFLGDGMLHGVQLQAGRALWYRSRYVRTPLYEQGLDIDDIGAPLGPNNQANVSLVHHGGRLLTSGEVGAPFRIDPRDLGTIGVHTFDGRLNTSFTAHPKIDPATGNMHFFGYFFVPPYLTYHVADPSGAIVHSQEIPVTAGTMIHSFAITDRDVIFWELPVLFDIGAIGTGGGFPFGWDASYGARIGILPLGGNGDQIRWVEIDPCYVFHELNAHREGDDVVIDVSRHDFMMNGERFGSDPLHVHRWRVSTAGSSLTFRDERVVDRGLEFPVHDRRFTGRPTRHGWFTVARDHPDTLDFGGVAHLDYATGDLRTWDPGPNRHIGETFFVPGGAGEGEGWLMTFTYDHARDTSSFLVLEAQDVEAGPVAEVSLPRRVPYGFHGIWVPEA